jgi:cell division protein FtsN
MATARKRTTKRTTASRSRSPAKSGRSNASFLAMGILAGLTIAILFYTVLIRQDANLTKGGGGPQYAHTPSQQNILTPLPPRPQHTVTPTTRSVEVEPQPQTPISIAESTALERPVAPTPAPSTQPKAPEQRVTRAPAPTPTPAPAPRQPKPSISEDPIGTLIAQNERRAAPATSAPKPAPKATPKDNVDHVGALIQTIPANGTTAATVTPNKVAPAVAAMPEKTVALGPAPTAQNPFYLQTGAYKTENEADAVRAQLLLMGHNNASIQKALVNKQTVYHVRVGPYNSSASLQAAQKSLEAAKLKFSPVH